MSWSLSTDVSADVPRERELAAFLADPSAQEAWRQECADLFALLAAGSRAQAATQAAARAFWVRAALDGRPSGALASALESVDDVDLTLVQADARPIAPCSGPAGGAGPAGVADAADLFVAKVAAARRLEGWALWQQLSGIAALLGQWRHGGTSDGHGRDHDALRCRTLDESELAQACVVTEVALAAGISEYVAGKRLDAALALVVDARLPVTAALLEQGLLDWSRVEMVVARTRDLTFEGARAVDTRVGDRLASLSLRKLAAVLDRAVLVVDAEAAHRREQAARTGRRVLVRSGLDGSGELWAAGPGEAITAAYNGLDAAARALRNAGDHRSLDQLRHDVMVTALTTGAHPGPAPGAASAAAAPRGGAGESDCGTAPGADGPVGEETAACAPADPPHPDEARAETACTAGECAEPWCGGSPPWFTTTFPQVQPQITVTVSLQTLLGLTEDPGSLAGYGPVSAAMARDLATDGTWRCVAVDDTHGTVLGLGRSTYTPAYTPGAALKAFLEHAAPTCDVPGCGVAARRCDLDHRVPYSAGVTCECNIRPLCRRHHRLKTAGLLTITASSDHDDPPGTMIYTTRTGRTYPSLPHVPLPRDGTAPGDGLLTRHRGPDRDADPALDAAPALDGVARPTRAGEPPSRPRDREPPPTPTVAARLPAAPRVTEPSRYDPPPF